MNHLDKNEFQNQFQKLNSIPRDEAIKQNTYREIINRNKKSGGLMAYINKFIVPVAAALVITLFALSTLTDLVKQDSNNSSVELDEKSIADIEPEKITIVYAAKSDELNTFQAKMYNGVPYIGTKLFQADEQWHRDVSSILANTKLVSEGPTSTPDIDLVVESEKNAPLKLKVWFSQNGKGYISEYNSNRFYEVREDHLLKLVISVKDLLGR
ncbi:hypothetical protein [Bacillus sp. m3-13]|uniref:hypothetical protein n=1 Tax=Bacillus sp. m3-13 TaxID=406124 RepID=UPI0001E89B30|nr:hypothetical protein [Bacillus sp. m3-13]